MPSVAGAGSGVDSKADSKTASGAEFEADFVAIGAGEASIAVGADAESAEPAVAVDAGPSVGFMVLTVVFCTEVTGTCSHLLSSQDVMVITTVDS